MTGLLLSAFVCSLQGQGQGQGIAPVVTQEMSSPEISLAAVVKLPKLGEKDRELLEVLVSVLPKGTEDFSRGTLMQVTDGRAIHAKLLPDSVVLSFSVPKGGLKSGISALNALLRNASLTQEDLDAALARRQRSQPSYWNAEFYPQSFELNSATRDAAEDVYHRVFTPEHTTIACIGAVEEADVDAAWAAKAEDWIDQPVADYPDISAPVMLAKNPSNITTVSIIGPSFSGNDPSLPTRLLALYALGSGKDNSLYRISRERHGWSYRQESILWPNTNGWEGRLFLAMIPADDTASRMEVLKGELLADVGGWTEQDRVRALGLAEATLERGLPYGPLVIGGDSFAGDQEHRAEIAAYWRMKTGTNWDAERLYKSMGFVTLADLKASAMELLSGGQVHVLPG